MKIPTIAVVGYGSWAKADKNPAGQIARDLGNRNWTDCNVVGYEMPVVSDRLTGEIEGVLAKYAPDAWIGIGVSTAAIIQPEVVGVNWRDFDVPDASGFTADHTAILAEGPTAYAATLPNVAIVGAIRTAGIPSSLSYHAGTHLCNQMLYTTSHIVAERQLPTLCGFIHIPQTPCNVVAKSAVDPHVHSMDIALSSKAIEICVQETVKFLVADDKG